MKSNKTLIKTLSVFGAACVVATVAFASNLKPTKTETAFVTAPYVVQEIDAVNPDEATATVQAKDGVVVKVEFDYTADGLKSSSVGYLDLVEAHNKDGVRVRMDTTHEDVVDMVSALEERLNKM